MSFVIPFICLLSCSLALAQDLRREMMVRSVRFFRDQAHPVTGLVRDRAQNFQDTPATNHVSSIASTGFGLVVLSHAESTGLLPAGEGHEQVLRTLRFARDHVPRKAGWFIHFADWETGKRVWRSEYSTIDTALLVAGALYAGTVFGGEVRDIAQRLHRDMNFYFFRTNNGSVRLKQTLTLSWTPEEGFVPWQWLGYSEHMVMLLLGMGHPTRPMPRTAWGAWNRELFWQDLMGQNSPLFVHQYSHAFVDFRQVRDGHDNYHQNSVAVSRMHRRGADEFGFWGWSAGDAPGGYRVYNPQENNGTYCIGCALASAMFLPDEVLADAQRWVDGPHREKIWGRYGFVDGVNPGRDWWAPTVLGITVGPLYMALANTTEESIWKRFMSLPEMQQALRRIRR